MLCRKKLQEMMIFGVQHEKETAPVGNVLPGPIVPVFFGQSEVDEE